MANPFLELLSQNAPGVILGVVLADGKFAAKVRFARGTNMPPATAFVKAQFCKWSKCTEEQIEWGESLFEFTVEIRVK